MLNQCILVGRLESAPVLVTLPDNRVKTTIVLNIQRGYKDSDTGLYEVDALPVTLWSGIAENTVEYCKAGSTIGIKARLKCKDGVVEIIGEKVTFINTKQD